MCRLYSYVFRRRPAPLPSLSHTTAPHWTLRDRLTISCFQFVNSFIFPLAVFLAWLGVSYVRYIYFIQPTLKWAKNTELEKMSKLLSDYQRITGLFSQYAGLFGMNVLSAAMVCIAHAPF
jgi:hypothetical protein